MVRAWLNLVVFDAVVLFILYYVLTDLAWRNAYALGQHPNLSPSTTFGILTRVFILEGGKFPLRSALTLDWVQVWVVTLVLLNGMFAVGYLRRIGRTRRKEGQAAANTPTAISSVV